jgi:hypothetical protein
MTEGREEKIGIERSGFKEEGFSSEQNEMNRRKERK